MDTEKMGKPNQIAVMILVIATVMIAATAALTITTQDAFAYESSQAGSLANACGNGEEPFNILCQNLMSEIQGDGNAVNIIGLQTGGERTPRGSPTEPPVGGAEDTCVTCFTRALSADEQQGFLGRVFLVRGEINVPTLEEFCKTVLSRTDLDFIAALLGPEIVEGDTAVQGMNINQDRIDQIIGCLHRVLGI